MSSSVHVDNKKKDILIFGECPTQELDGTTLTAEKLYSINFTENNKKISLSLQYNGPNCYLFVNGTEIYKFKAKDSEILAAPLCLGNISKDFSVDNMKKTGLNELLKKCLGILKKCFFTAITFFSYNVLNVNSLKCVSVNNQECKIRSEIINVNTNETVFYPYSGKINKCKGSCIICSNM